MRSWLQQVEFGYQPSDRGVAGILDNVQLLNEKFKEPQRDAPAHSAARSEAKSRRQQDSAVDGHNKPHRQEKNTEAAEQVEGKDTLIAFDDKELSAWVMRFGEERSGRFLCALAEAVMKANAEEYSVIRPALLDLKHRRRHRAARAEKAASPIARKKQSNHDSPPQSGGL
ncbi:MAG TPA: hypothetical protein VFE61_20565 [Candidatus Sulfotelmatobacter sp.]|jgi:hypothetical protein|nr:hypothetical protein [Candidatus Sulfotelmatobacter sp.]